MSQRAEEGPQLQRDSRLRPHRSSLSCSDAGVDRVMIPPDVSAATLLAIQNTISRYCLALDTHDFSILKAVFTADLQADYSAVSPQNKDIRGLDSMIDRLMVILEGKTTQHALSTQILDFEPQKSTPGGYECKAITYFTANTFVDNNCTKGGLDHVTVYGRYEDSIVEVTPGEWRIRERIVKTFVSQDRISLIWEFVLRPVLITINAASSHPQPVDIAVRPSITKPFAMKPMKPIALSHLALKTETMDVLSDTASFFLPSSPESS